MLDIIKQRFAGIPDDCFENTLRGMEVISADGGEVKIRLPVAKHLQNLGGVLHGGAIATLVDIAGTIAILTADRQHRIGTSTDLNVSYFAPGSGVVLVEARVLKSGKTLAFVTVEIRREADQVLVAQGRMTKHMD